MWNLLHDSRTCSVNIWCWCKWSCLKPALPDHHQANNRHTCHSMFTYFQEAYYSVLQRSGVDQSISWLIHNVQSATWRICKLSSYPPFPQIDIIGGVVIVWRVRGKIIRSVLCNIVCNNCAQCDAHTYKQTNSSLDWVLSHWAHFTVLDSFLYCVLLCVVYMLTA